MQKAKELLNDRQMNVSEVAELLAIIILVAFLMSSKKDLGIVQAGLLDGAEEKNSCLVV